MKVFAFDKCSHNDADHIDGRCDRTTCTNYMKQWDRLDPNVQVFISGMDAKWEELQNDTATWLLLVHQSCYWPLPNSHKRGLVMYVSGGSGCTNPDDPQKPWMHYSRRCVPTPGDLSFLASRFERLCENLEQAGGDGEKIRLAWAEWERPVMEQVMEILSPLSIRTNDSALAAYVGRRMDALASGIGEAGIRMAVGELERINEQGAEGLIAVLQYSDFSGEVMGRWINEYPGSLAVIARGLL